MKSLHLFALLLLVVTVASYGIGGSGDSGEDRYNKGDISVLPSVDEIDRRYNVKKAPIKPPRRDRRVNHGRRRNGPRRGRKMGKGVRACSFEKTDAFNVY